MLNTRKEVTWLNTKSLIIATLLAIAVTDSLPVRAELIRSIDNNTRCLWVDTAEHLTQMGSHENLHSEPQDDRLVEEDVNIITGLYTRTYSRQQNGIVDYKTARQIVISEYNEYWNTVVHTNEFPLFYWEDADHDGEFEMWIDRQGDGAPCDIIPYQAKNILQTADTKAFDIQGL